MSPPSMVIDGRALAVEAAMGHCRLWGPSAPPLLPADRYNGRVYAQEMVQLLQWGAQRGINGIDILHGERGGYADPGGLLLEEEALRLKIPFGVGGHVGHGYPHFLPQALFAGRPELFRMDGGGHRTPTGNLCTANPEALGRAVGELTKLLDRHPRARVIQIFPDDAFGGSWCSCPKCKARTPVEQYATLLSAVAGAMDARMPGIQVGMCLYHDTLTGLPDKPVLPDGSRFVAPNVYALYAPRERCYAHAINDAGCPRNRLYWRCAQRAKEVFEGRLDVFEYYGDTILWQYFNVAIPHVIAADLAAYRSLSPREIQALAFGTYSIWAHGLNLATFAWLSSGMETSADAAIARYARERFGPQVQDRMVAYYTMLEKAQANYLAFCRYEDDWLHDLRGFGKPSPGYAEHRRRVAEAKELFKQLAEMLTQAAAQAKGDEFVRNLAAEQAHLEITRIELDQLDMRLAIGERITSGGSGAWTEQEESRRVVNRQWQWGIAQKVPAEIRGQAFGAQAP
jgi:hypothetical protein